MNKTNIDIGSIKTISVYERFRAFTIKVLPVRFVKLMRKIKIANLLLSLKVALKSDYLLAYWCDINNFGDRLNPILIKYLSGKEVVHAGRVINFAGKPIIYSVGSTLKEVHSKNSLIWGAGFIDSDDYLKQIPRKIFAVRGPLTRNKLIENGIDCPEIYGDPALLLPFIFNLSVPKQYKLGIVPHYVDKNDAFLKYFISHPDVLIIDIEDTAPGFIANITKCETIASSSLHGLIVADAYGIPSIWIKISDNLAGDNFKFLDYFASVGRKEMAPFHISKNTTIESLLSLRKECKIQIDLEKLLKSCPYIDKRIEEKIFVLISHTIDKGIGPGGVSTTNITRIS